MTGQMEEVISLSSDDSDLEIVGSYGGFTKSKPPPPLSEVRVDVEAVNVNIPRHYIDLTDPRWACPELKLRPRFNIPGSPVVDLTANETKETKPETKSSLALTETRVTKPEIKGCFEIGDSQFNQSIVNKNNVLNGQGFKLQESSSGHSHIFPLQQDCGTQSPKQRCLNSPMQPQKQNLAKQPSQDAPDVEPDQLPFIESHIKNLKTSGSCVQLINDSPQMSLCFKPNNRFEAQESATSSEIFSSTLYVSLTESTVPKCLPIMLKSTTKEHENPQEYTSNLLQAQATQDLQIPTDCPNAEHDDANLKQHKTIENKLDGFHSSDMIPSSTSYQDKTQKEAICSNLEKLDLYPESGQRSPSDHPSSHSSQSSKADSVSYPGSSPLNHTNQGCQSPRSPYTPTEKTCEWELESQTYEENTGGDSPISLPWQGESDREDTNEESRCCTNFREASREDRRHVCPITLKKLMSGHHQVLIDKDNVSPKAPEVLCRQSLSLVYSTIEENYPEGTLQLLSDLLQPGFYPPKDITTHLLRGILLDPHCPHHLSLQAYNLLMRTQRHHRANRSSVPWDWELLTSVMSNQLEQSKQQYDGKKENQWDIICLLLEYCVQTLEDDFTARCSSSSLSHSIAKATLSCDRQFSRVRDVIKWLFCVIMKTTENEDSKEGIKIKDEQMRIVSVFQRMLSLALEVDRSPALNSAKLSHELFHMVLSHMPLRAHRMLLLESLQSKLLSCKLLEQLLDYACPEKVSIPMSLKLLLHFLKNCTLASDPTDGLERWRKWEELIHLLWMLLLSYSKAMKGCLTSSPFEQIGKEATLVYKPDDMVSKSAVQEAVNAFLSRSQEDIGEALPLHVEESLTYLQDHLLDVCQC
ncbi:SUMO-interacting motif-containing protein 1 [Xiphophorus maculatus]|uniref:SUMO-interacting motif-containing protein 1 n=1 Tax=Xiphophorus maculatus TaxID=8083 RepID=UPI000C6E59D0|nr:SUMO-interacting motif-containing protein 1 [Xiphophorus maculatus]